MDWNDLKKYSRSNDDDDDFVQQCWNEALDIIIGLVGYADADDAPEDAPRVVPQSILDRCKLEVGDDLYHRREAPNGLQQYNDIVASSPVRIARDPALTAKKILSTWIRPGIA